MIHLLQTLTLFQLYQGDFNGSLHYTINTSYLYPLEKNIEQFDLSIDLNFSQRIDLTIGLTRNYTIQASESSITISRKLIQQQIIEFYFNGPSCKYQFQGYLSKSTMRSLKIASFEIGILDQSASLEYLIEKPKISGFYRLQIEIISGQGIMGFQRCYSEKNDSVITYDPLNRQQRFIDFEYNIEECYFDACKILAGFQADQLSEFRISLFNVNKTIPHRIIIYANQEIHQDKQSSYSIFAEAGTTLVLFFQDLNQYQALNFNQILNTLQLRVNSTQYVHFQLEYIDLSFKVELLSDVLAMIPSVIFQELPILMLIDSDIIIQRTIFITNQTNLDKLISQIRGIKFTVEVQQNETSVTQRFYMHEISEFKYFNQTIQTVNSNFISTSQFNIIMKAELYIEDMTLPFIQNNTVQLTTLNTSQQTINNQATTQGQNIHEHEGLKNIILYVAIALALLGFILYFTNKKIDPKQNIKQEDEEMHSINSTENTHI